MIQLSIVIPFYNGEAYFPSLIASLAKSSRNASLSFEVIVVIDSPASDPELVRSQLSETFSGISNCMHVQVFKNPANIGVAASRNIGLDAASGEYFICIDQDDEVEPNFFGTLMQPMAEGKHLILLNGIIHYTSGYKTHLMHYLTPSMSLKSIILDDIVRSPGQIVLSTKLSGNLRFPVPRTHLGADDKFFWIRIYLDNPHLQTYFVKAPVYRANIHRENFSHDRTQLHLSSLEMWEQFKPQIESKKTRRYMRLSIAYLKFTLRSRVRVSFAELLIGLYATLWYFSRPNRFVRFIMKRF